MKKKILVTGGAGFIGSHTTLALLEAGYQVVVLDNLSNSSIESIRRVGLIANKDVEFLEGDILDRQVLNNIFIKHNIFAVMHFAGLKSVSESTCKPLDYYENNVAGSVALCQSMAAAGVFNLIFSSSATVYGEPVRIPIDESCPTTPPTNPYGRSKLMVEDILHDLVKSDQRWSVGLLRYFNPVGAHSSGMIGEDPNGIPNNLVPYITQVAIGKLEALSIFGNDYPTCDGTGVRDYIHVVDLAHGHIKALNAISSLSGINIWNLGTGKGYSVLEIVRAFEQASGCRVRYKFAPRRSGDIAECWSDPSKAERELGWKAEFGIDRMCVDSWRWQSNNPNGYAG